MHSKNPAAHSIELSSMQTEFPEAGVTFILDIALPRNKNQIGDAPVLQTTAHQVPVLLQCDPLGRLLIHIARPDGRICRTQFQPLQVIPYGFIRLGVAIEGPSGHVKLFVQGKELYQDPFRRLPARVIHSDDLVPEQEQIIAPVDPSSSPATFEEALFYRTLLDLQDRIYTADWYSTLRAAVLLRQLLIDRFIHAVNRPYGIDIEFYVVEKPLLSEIYEQPESTFGFIEGNAVDRSKKVKLDAFLGTNILRHKGQELTVYQVIDAAANAKGGVHIGRAKPNGQQEVLEFDENQFYGNLPPSLLALQSIARVTLRALRPLAEKVALASVHRQHSPSPYRMPAQ
jgi:hypothetical protein